MCLWLGGGAQLPGQPAFPQGQGSRALRVPDARGLAGTWCVGTRGLRWDRHSQIVLMLDVPAFHFTMP